MSDQVVMPKGTVIDRKIIKVSETQTSIVLAPNTVKWLKISPAHCIEIYMDTPDQLTLRKILWDDAAIKVDFENASRRSKKDQ